MTLNQYFESVEGIGVLATADAEGKVDVALYSRPHFLGSDDRQLTFIMADRLSHHNLESNPHAAYLFVEEGKVYVGKRLYLTKTGEETDREKIRAIRRRHLPPECEGDDSETRYLVHFRVDAIRPLVGDSQ